MVIVLETSENDVFGEKWMWPWMRCELVKPVARAKDEGILKKSPGRNFCVEDLREGLDWLDLPDSTQINLSAQLRHSFQGKVLMIYLDEILN